MCVHGHFPINPEHGRLKKDDHEFEVNFGHIVRLCQRKGWGVGGGVEGQEGRECANMESCFLCTALLVLCLQCRPPVLTLLTWFQGYLCLSPECLTDEEFCRIDSCIHSSFLSVFLSSTYASNHDAVTLHSVCILLLDQSVCPAVDRHLSCICLVVVQIALP